MLKRCAGVRQSNITVSAFEQYLKAVNNPEDRFLSHDEDVVYFIDKYLRNQFCIIFEELNLPITEDCILKAIRQLQTNKSDGPDMF